jgi:hypothetical protein
MNTSASDMTLKPTPTSVLRQVYNVELSWLAFNWRVALTAQHDSVPLWEQLRFLAITSANLDEFFAKRVTHPTPACLSPLHSCVFLSMRSFSTPLATQSIVPLKLTLRCHSFPLLHPLHVCL